MSILELIKTNPDYSDSKEELNNLLKECYAELELQSSANINNKIKINAGYGIQTVSSFRFKKHLNAEAITSCGQLCVRGCGNYIEKMLKDKEYQISNQYFDTDSIFLNFRNKLNLLDKIEKESGFESAIDTIIDWNKEHVQPLINDYFDKMAIAFNAMENMIEMDFELIADKSTFFAPKKYIMRKVWDKGKYIKPSNNSFKFRGIEIVRTTTPLFFRNKLKEAVIIIFNGTNDDLIDFISQTKKEYFELSFEEMANPTGVNGMDKYTFRSKHIPVHVFGSLVYNEYIKHKGLDNKYQYITDKAKIKISYIKKPNCLNSHIISVPNNIFPDELKELIDLDYEKMFEKNFMKPINRFLNVVGWSDKKSYSLDELF